MKNADHYYLNARRMQELAKEKKQSMEFIMPLIENAANEGKFRIKLVENIDVPALDSFHKENLEKLGFKVTSSYVQPYSDGLASDQSKQETSFIISWEQ